jgi:transcriptional regulator with PAS, ATPase and Fis domain
MNKTEQDYLWEALKLFDDRVDEPKALHVEVAELEKNSILGALAMHEGNRSKAAKELGMGRTNLIAKIKKYDLVTAS